MRRLVIALCLCAAVCDAQLLGELMRLRGRTTTATTSDLPPGWSQSLFWWKFTGTSTNITDYSAVATNEAIVYPRSSDATNWVLDGTAFKPKQGDYGANYNKYAVIKSKSAAIGNGLVSTQYTFAVWFKPLAFVQYSGFLTTRSTRRNLLSDSGAGKMLADCNGVAVNAANGTDPILSSGTWYRVVCVRYSPNVATSYVNGVWNHASAAINTNAFVGDAEWFGGTDNADPNGRTINGWIDDCYFTTYPWTAVDVSNDYARGRSQ